MEENRRRPTSVRQLELLIEFLEEHTDLALGRIRSKEGRAVADRLWTRIADILNAEGSHRTPKEWAKFWNDYKCRVRSKLALIRRNQTGTGGGPSVAPQLSPLEERMAALIGRDVGPLPGVRRDPIINYEIQAEEPVIVMPPLDEEIPVVVVLEDQDSPLIDISSLPRWDTDRSQETLAVEQPSTSNRDNVPEPPNLVDQVTTENVPGQPSTSQNEGRDRTSRRERRSIRPRVPAQHQTRATSALSEAEANVARIELIRSRTEETVANISLRQAENFAQLIPIVSSIADSLRILAERAMRD